MRTVVLVIVAVLAGCASGGHGAGLDTGEISPGGEATLTFAQVGAYPLHCHPHPGMKHSVTVAEGAALEAHVHVFDGNATDEGRFEPSDLTVGPGAVVTYHNHGQLVHTATQESDGGAH